MEGNQNEWNAWTLESDAKTMLNQLKVPNFDQPMSELSGGQKKRVALAQVLLSEADILILDEPTNHLDNAMSEWLEDYLTNSKSAVVMVTHDRYFLDRVSNRIVELDKDLYFSGKLFRIHSSERGEAEYRDCIRAEAPEYASYRTGMAGQRCQSQIYQAEGPYSAY